MVLYNTLLDLRHPEGSSALWGGGFGQSSQLSCYLANSDSSTFCSFPAEEP